MATQNQSEQIAGLTELVVRLHQRDNLAGALRMKARLDTTAVAKACGTTASVVNAWEAGQVRPTTNEALRWLNFLWDAQRAPAGPAPKRDSADLPKAPVVGKDGKTVKP